VRRTFTILASFGACLSLLATSVAPANALTVPASFRHLAQSPLLAHPGIILIDPSTQETIFSSAPDALRAPASVLKLLSTSYATATLGAETTFHTSISETAEPGKFLIIGQLDPWLTTSLFESNKYHRAFLPSLINEAYLKNIEAKVINIDFFGLHNADIALIKKFYAGTLTLNFHRVNSESAARAEASSPMTEIVSPPLKDIVGFTLLWSDNILADRLARLAAAKDGFPSSATGIQSGFEKFLGAQGIDTVGLHVYDGNGLSKENKVSARTIGQLLLKIRTAPDLAAVYAGLPLAGKTGTLKDRFIKDAPRGVGLIKAKTGWINGTVSLAGYVDVGSNQYIFAIIADKIKPTEPRRQLARETIDKMLATIAKPKA
jgi:D-alanyl-D-alanine carboxypeptidase